jgi:hypothetical protein
MTGEAQQILRINYFQGDEPRFIKGILKSETDEYIEIELNKYITKIYKKYIIKTEVEKHGRDAFVY